MTIHVLRTPMREVCNERDGRARWCFTCRRRRVFRWIVTETIEPSYYDPNITIRCGKCGTADGDLFPGMSREWA